MSYLINGLNVHFPYDAYNCQLDYFSQVVKSLQKRENALLESPTGTGKTLCLLCSCLSWMNAYKALSQLHQRFSFAEMAAMREKRDVNQEMANFVEKLETSVFGMINPVNENIHKDPPPKIYYASRTHSQLSQVVHELKNTIFQNTKICVLGSREQSCVDEKVKIVNSSAGRAAMCKQLTSDNKCSHYRGVKDAKQKVANEFFDIEELVSFGKLHIACPYYLSRSLQPEADIIFLPYNYLVDPTTRAAQKINLQNSIIIFDEAHNLESSCSDASSFDLSTSDLDACIRDVNICREISERPDYSQEHTSDEFKILAILIRKFLEKINEVELDGNQEAIRPGSFIYELFESANIKPKNAPKLISMVEGSIRVLAQDEGKKRAKVALSSFLNVLRSVFGGVNNPKDVVSFQSSYKVYIGKEKSKMVNNNGTWASSNTAPSGRVLSFWCFNSGVAMKSLIAEGCRSIILTSGTLSPLISFAVELGIPFQNRLENPHVIKSDQIFSGVFPVGPSGSALNSSYKSRDSETYKNDLGNSLVNFCRLVPDGILVFFTSYGLMENSIQCWKRPGPNGMKSIWDRITQFKEPFVEPRDKTDFGKAIDSFYSKFDETIKNKVIDNESDIRGGIFFAVCRGKASEGIDFADTRCRAVVITGIPYPSVADPRVKLKRSYMDDLANSQSRSNNSLDRVSGEMWYTQQAARAVNQAIGRVIRHRNDWGAILLCDDRFLRTVPVSLGGSGSNVVSDATGGLRLPLWLREYTRGYKTFGEGVGVLTRFFRTRKLLEPDVSSKSKPAITNPDSVKSGSIDILQSNIAKQFGIFGGLILGDIPLNRGLIEYDNENGVRENNMKMRQVRSVDIGNTMNGSHSASTLERNRKEGYQNENGLGGVKHSTKSSTDISDLVSSRPLNFGQGIASKRLLQRHNSNLTVNQTISNLRNSLTTVVQGVTRVTDKFPKSTSTSEEPLNDNNSSSKPKGKSGEYITELKSQFNAEGYKRFTEILRGLKMKMTKIEDALPQLISLFKEFYVPPPLFRRLKDYLPSKFHDDFKTRADKYEIEFTLTQKKRKLEHVDPPVPPVGHNNTSNPTSEVLCVVCKKIPQQPFSAKCDHIACHECWIMITKGKSSCPKCQVKTRLKQLTKVYFQ